MDRLRFFLSKSHGRLSVDDGRVLDGIIFVSRNDLRWRDAPRKYGLHKTLCNPLEVVGWHGAFRADEG